MTDKPNRDRRPIAFRVASVTARMESLAEIWSRPKCTAKAKTTGVQCNNPVVRGKTKCRLHGGLVPAGKNWHRVQSTGDPKKDVGKAASIAKRKTKQAAYIAAMSPERKAAYDAWLRTHAPTSPEDRARRRADRAAAKAAQKRWSATPAAGPVSDEAKRLADLRTALEARLAELPAPSAPADPPIDDEPELIFPNEGVFS